MSIFCMLKNEEEENYFVLRFASTLQFRNSKITQNKIRKEYLQQPKTKMNRKTGDNKENS